MGALAHEQRSLVVAITYLIVLSALSKEFFLHKVDACSALVPEQ